MARVTRRTAVAAAALIPVSAVKAAPQATPGSAAASTFSTDQRRTLDALVERLIPADELGPSGVDGGACDYISVQLAGYLAPEKQTFLDGLAAFDSFAKTSQGGAFADLSVDKRDALLTAVATTAPQPVQAFLTRARRLAMEGMFGDPHYGGNKNFAGWDLIRYPGPRPAVSADDQRMGVEIKPYHRSAWGSEHSH